MNFENLLRDSDPVLEVSIPDPNMTEARALSEAAARNLSTTRRHPRSIKRQRPRYVVAVSTGVSFVLLAGVITTVLSRNSDLSGPVHTQWSAARTLPGSVTHVKGPAGTFVLADYITSEGWQQNTTGPEPGYLTCPTSLTCYVTGDSTASSSGSVKLGTLYVSNDGALDWSVLPLPAGLDFTTPLACDNAESCAAGATDNGQPVFISTVDGGHSFTIDPLPSADGKLYTLSCPSTRFCAGLAGTLADSNGTPIDATFLSTTNDGASFSNSSLPSGDSMKSLDCPTAATCVAVGTSDALGVNDMTAGVVASTTDAGASWTSGALPAGFGTDFSSRLTCVDAEHCSVIGIIAISAEYQVCPGTPPSNTPTPPTSQSPAIRAIANMESAIAAAAYAKMPSEGVGSYCSSSPAQFVSDIASTSDGGLTWLPEALPSSAPNPDLSDIACSGAEYCVAAGSEDIPQHFGPNKANGSSAMMLVTRDGGASWSDVTFAVPSSVPSGVRIDAFMAVGAIQCPQVNNCIALGISDQGSKTTPVYTSAPNSPTSNAS